MVGARFLRLLNAELEDCEEDLRDLDDMLRQRQASREITDYVYWENDALLKREIVALQSIRSAVSSLWVQVGDISGTSLDELSALALETARAQVMQHQYPMAVMPLIERRIQRIREFLGQESTVR